MENETSSPNIEILDLDVKSFNALKRAGINTIADIEAQTEQLGSTIPPRQWTNIIKALNAYKGIPIPGSWVEEDMLGEELTFDEIADMVGEIIIMDKSTVSHAWYKAVKVEKILTCEDGGRRLMYYDGSNQRGIVGEMYFDKNQRSPVRAWRVKLPDKPAEPPAPVQSEASVAAAFDYSELDNSIAKSLKDCETVIRQETAGYFTLLGAKFKEAQDLLANHSSGTFERWYTSMGFKRQTVYNLIQRYEFSSSPTIGGREEAFENLSLTLSYDISKPDAPSELVNKVLDGDITTHKDYIALKKDYELAQQSNKSLQEANDHIFNASKKNYKMYDEERIKNYELEKQLAQVKEDLKELDEYRERNAELEQRDDELQRKNDVLEQKKQELEQHIKELENRPVEVAVQSDEEALAEKNQEISELKDEVERLSNKNVKVFAVRLTLDEYEKLVQIVCGGCRGGNDPVILEAVKKAQIIRL